MSDYFNRKADLNRGMPTGKGLNGLGGQQGVVHWNDVDDAGINAAERNANLAAAQKTVAHPFTSIAAGGVSQSVLGAAALKMNEADFPPNAEFSAAQALLDAPQWQTQKYNQEETDYLTKARSDEEFQYRIERVEKYRTMTDLGDDNPISSLVGAFLGDAPFMFAPQAATSSTFKIR